MRDVQLGGWGCHPCSYMVPGRDLASEKRGPEENLCYKTKVLLVQESYCLLHGKKKKRERFGFSENKEEMEDRIFFF